MIGNFIGKNIEFRLIKSKSELFENLNVSDYDRNFKSYRLITEI